MGCLRLAPRRDRSRTRSRAVARGPSCRRRWVPRPRCTAPPFGPTPSLPALDGFASTRGAVWPPISNRSRAQNRHTTSPRSSPGLCVAIRGAMPTTLLRRTVSGLFMVGIPGPGLDDDTRRVLIERPPGGVILFRRNVRSAEQLRDLTGELHELGAGAAPLIALDHEGGRVHRLPAPFTHFPPAATVAAGGDARLVESVGLAMGRELAAVGIDVDFAPVLDVWSNPRNQVIGDRAFGTTPGPVARLGPALARGLSRGGVLPCGKHFPGHGGTLGDSHHVLPRVTTPRRRLDQVDLAPFVRAIRAHIPALMTAHVVYAALDPRRPATLSSRICHDLLRRRLGFRGVLFSDDLEMQAVAGRRTP